MSQAARDNNAINLGQGFPDDPGPEDIRRAAADASLNGYNQYPSMMGIPELRQAIAAHYGHWHKLKLDPMTEVMVTSGGTEALTSAILGGGRARRRGDLFPAGLRFLSADHPPGRRHSAAVAARAAALAADRGDAAQRLQSQDQGGAVQQSAQPGRRGLSARGPRTAGAVLPGVRLGCDLRRGLGARDLRRPRAHSADHHSRHARPHHQGRLGRKNLLADGLEDRLCLRRAAAAARRRQGASVPDLHHRAEPAGRGCLRPLQARRLFLRHAQSSLRRAATVSPRASKASAFPCCARRGPISSPSTCRRSG